MAKTTTFPVKTFKIRGSALSERERLKVVRNAMTGELTWVLVPHPKKVKKAVKDGDAKKPPKKVGRASGSALKLERTATGSGKVKFSFETRPILAGTSSKKRA